MTNRLDIGTPVILTADVDRFPDAYVRAGAIGIVVEWSDGGVFVELAEPVDGLEEWDNVLAVHYPDEDGNAPVRALAPHEAA